MLLVKNIKQTRCEVGFLKKLFSYSKLFLLFVNITFFSGCVRYVPRPFDPSIELSNIELRAFQELEVEVPETQNSYFPFASSISLCDGLSLPEANALAFFYSAKIIKARIDYGISTGLLIEAGFPDNPSVFIGPRFTKDHNLIFPAFLEFSVYLTDILQAQRAAAEWEVERNKWLVINTEITILANVQKGFLDVDAETQLEEVALKRSERAQELLQWLTSLYNSGQTNPYLLQVAQRRYEDAKLEHMNAHIKKKKAQTSLLKTIGLLPDTDIDIQIGPLPLLTFDIDLIERNSILSNPSLRAIELEYLSAEDKLRAEVAAQYPTLRIGPQFESDREDVSLGFGLGLDIPIFKLNRTNIAVAEEKRNQVRNQYYTTLLDLWEQFTNLQIERQAVIDRDQDLESSIMLSAQKLNKVFSEALRTDEDTLLEQLDAADAIASTFVEAIELRRRLGIVTIDLLVTSGVLLPKNFCKSPSTEDDTNEP